MLRIVVVVLVVVVWGGVEVVVKLWCGDVERKCGVA